MTFEEVPLDAAFDDGSCPDPEECKTVGVLTTFEEWTEASTDFSRGAVTFEEVPLDVAFDGGSDEGRGAEVEGPPDIRFLFFRYLFELRLT